MLDGRDQLFVTHVLEHFEVHGTGVATCDRRSNGHNCQPTLRTWAERELLVAGPELNDAVVARVGLNLGRDLRVGLAHEHAGSE